MMTDRRLHLGPVAGTVAHHGFELAAGVGLVFQPYVGLGGAAAGWGVALPVWTALALRRGDRGDGLLALLAGVSLAGALLHYKLWPVRWRPIPVLVDAEGLSERQLPVYNAILYAWSVSSLVAATCGTPRGSRRYAALGLLAAVPLSASARHHFGWLHEVAEERPAWWNRAARRSTATT
jgi:hypothetical protein